ncbi:putative jasmonate O-methyltransferase [Helianthus debilis subsp. tardiflorus]
MSLENILHMNAGDGESSYANNSLIQENGIRQAMPFLKHMIKGLANYDVFSDRFTFADLGCSSGTNTLLVASNIIDTVHEVCQENDRKVPQFQVCLKDLFRNDFNTTFKLLPDFYAKLKKEKGESFGPCFVSAVPVLSMVPQGLESNRSNIYMARASPPDVYQAYPNQFHTDFTKFLQMRSDEVVRGGRMILTFAARGVADPSTDDCCALLELLGQSLVDMMKEVHLFFFRSKFELKYKNYFGHKFQLFRVISLIKIFSKSD